MIEGVEQVADGVFIGDKKKNVMAQSILYKDKKTGIRPMIALCATEKILSGERLFVEYPVEEDVSDKVRCFPRSISKPKEFDPTPEGLVEDMKKRDKAKQDMKKRDKPKLQLTDDTIAMVGGPPLTLVRCNTSAAKTARYALVLSSTRKGVGPEALADEDIPQQKETSKETTKAGASRRKTTMQTHKTSHYKTNQDIEQGVIVGLLSGAWAFHDTLQKIPSMSDSKALKYAMFMTLKNKREGLILDPPPTLSFEDGAITGSCNASEWIRQQARTGRWGERVGYNRGDSECRLRRLVCVPDGKMMVELEEDEADKFMTKVLHRHAVAVQAVQAVATTSDDVPVAQAVAVTGGP